jgi:peptidoglycan/xylan/chitin deacetylase (PgdA/CDA1 family)
MPQRRLLVLATLSTIVILTVAAAAALGLHGGSMASPDRPVAHWAEGPAERSAPGTAGSNASSHATANGSVAPNGSGTGGGQQPNRTTRTVGPLNSRILTGSSAIALTFDDGPDPRYTPLVLDLLKQYKIKATFCLIGSRARDYPALVRRIVAEGHTVCNHSWQHLIDLGKRPRSYQSWDLRSTNDAIHAAAPNAQIRLFRAPGGNFTPGLISVAGSLGMSPIYWDVDPRDWDAATYGRGTPMVNHIVGVAERMTRPGSIVLSHDRAHPDTIAAYKILLPWLKARYRLVAL